MPFVGGAAIPLHFLKGRTWSDFFDNLLPLDPQEKKLKSIAPAHDLISDWPVRDQDFDPTCVAFAAAAALELRIAHRSAAKPQWLSPAYLYWKMRCEFPITSDPPVGYQDGATLLSQARDVISTFGACLEVKLTYSSARFGRTEDGFNITWVEPRNANELASTLLAANEDAKARKLEAAKFGYAHLPKGPRGARLSRLFHDALSTGKPVVVAVPVWPTGENGKVGNWATVEAQSQGVVRAPCDKGHDIPAQALPFAGHAVCLIGFQEGKEPDDLGWFIFRNSLGRDFGRNADVDEYGVPAPGYGVISALHIDLFCWEYLVFD
ncbi:hypothetical protein LJR009_005395 [Bosea sp. LjRoot9]|uniref:hypothetical protein n=1 Tax=Bosea sp. LjRoot9 TaxID=3342341 RepID=UPI003ED077D2